MPQAVIFRNSHCSRNSFREVGIEGNNQFHYAFENWTPVRDCILAPSCKIVCWLRGLSPRITFITVEGSDKKKAMSYGRNECRIYVGNLPPDIRTKDIQDLFYKFGKVTFVDLKNRRGPPFAFVEFEDPR